LVFLTQNKAKLCKNSIITLVFEKNANFFAENCRKSPKIVENRRKLSKIAENCRKSPKIVIITSTPGKNNWCRQRWKRERESFKCCERSS
jgi:hypothetical protein